MSARAWMLTLALLLPSAAGAAPNILSVSPAVDAQAMAQISPAIAATAGAGVINSPVFVDYDTGTPMLDVANGAATTIFSVATGANVNHQPYVVAVWPFALNPLLYWDGSYYTNLNAAHAVMATNGFNSTALPTSKVMLSASALVVTSTNSGDGNAGVGGWGSEFLLSANYLGLDTSNDSKDSGNLGGMLGALLYNHGSWNAFDAHAVLRQTASNWPSGYSHSAQGYGTVSYTAANAVAGTIYLQPPGALIANAGHYAVITLYPFRQTRRSKEVVYIGGTWPAASTVNELTPTQVTAAGGTLIYTSNGTDVTPTFTYAPAASGSATFYFLTLDASGNASRIEEYNGLTASFIVSTSCNQ